MRCGLCAVAIPTTTIQDDSDKKFASAVCAKAGATQVDVHAKLWNEAFCYVCQFRLVKGLLSLLIGRSSLITESI